MKEDTAKFWDREAATFDEVADHGLRDPTVRAAWADLLLPFLPSAPATVIDLGCGTGSLSVMLAEAGHDVRGLDFSARMVHLAREKAARASVVVQFDHDNAAAPPYPPECCDVVIARHVLWALVDHDEVLSRWVGLLRPGGTLMLVEGQWNTGAGMSAKACEALVRQHRDQVEVTLLPDPTLWGRPIDDERYLIVSRR